MDTFPYLTDSLSFDASSVSSVSDTVTESHSTLFNGAAMRVRTVDAISPRYPVSQSNTDFRRPTRSNHHGIRSESPEHGISPAHRQNGRRTRAHGVQHAYTRRHKTADAAFRRDNRQGYLLARRDFKTRRSMDSRCSSSDDGQRMNLSTLRPRQSSVHRQNVNDNPDIDNEPTTQSTRPLNYRPDIVRSILSLADQLRNSRPPRKKELHRTVVGRVAPQDRTQGRDKSINGVYSVVEGNKVDRQSLLGPTAHPIQHSSPKPNPSARPIDHPTRTGWETFTSLLWNAEGTATSAADAKETAAGKHGEEKAATGQHQLFLTSPQPPASRSEDPVLSADREDQQHCHSYGGRKRREGLRTLPHSHTHSHDRDKKKRREELQEQDGQLAQQLKQKLNVQRVLLDERGRKICELEKTVSLQNGRMSRLEHRIESLTTAFSASQRRIEDVKRQQHRHLESLRINKQKELLYHSQIADAERQEQEAIISQTALQLEAQTRDLVRMERSLLSCQRELDGANQRLQILDGKMCVLQAMKQLFRGVRIFPSSDRRPPVTLGLVEDVGGMGNWRSSRSGP